MLPRDQKETRETALIDRQLGVSDDTLLMHLGYDPDLEREKEPQILRNSRANCWKILMMANERYYQVMINSSKSY